MNSKTRFFPCPHLNIDAIDEVVIKKMAQKKLLAFGLYQVLCCNHAVKFQHETVYHLCNKKYIYIYIQIVYTLLYILYTYFLARFWQYEPLFNV